jgi:hypothetical protein
MTREFDKFSIQHADVVPDGSCVLLAVEVTHGLQGVRPMKASPVRKLVGEHSDGVPCEFSDAKRTGAVFNIENQKVEQWVIFTCTL